MPVDEMDEAMSEIARKIRTVIGGPVFLQPSGDVDARKALVGELDVWIGLVVAQQDVVARLVLLDEIVLECQRFFVVVDKDIVDVSRFRIRVPVFASARRSSLK